VWESRRSANGCPIREAACGIAGLAKSESVFAEFVGEAIPYRTPDRNLWAAENSPTGPSPAKNPGLDGQWVMPRKAYGKSILDCPGRS